jgi:isoleucyl-tRNA synthetase
VEAGYARYETVAVMREFEAYYDDVSNWYIRRSRRRFYAYDEAAFRTLWYALVQSLRVIAPVMPFLAEHLWRALVSDVSEGAPESVFLAGWPEARTLDAGLLAEVAELRTVVALGHQARSAAGLKLRQPLRRIVVEGAPLAAAHADEIAEELRVKEVELGHVDAELRVKPHLPALGPKLGKELGAVRAALQAGDFEELGDGRFRAAGHDLAADEVLVERAGKDGWAVAADAGVTVAIDMTVDDELALEGRVYELIHRVNSMRKDAGLELTDRITLTLPGADADLLEHSKWIASETLALSVATDEIDAPKIAIA